MNDFTAIILAAGMGVRMGPRGRLQPKGLIEIGGVPLVAQSVDSLRAWGVARIRIVTGHLAEQFEASFTGQDVELVHNPYYATTGSLRTLSIGLQGLLGPCVILESDLIYAPQALDPLCENNSRLVTSGPTGAGDEVYVWTDSGADGTAALSEISKQKSTVPKAPFGELVGITGLNAEAVALMPGVAARVLERTPDEHYEHGLVALARECPIEVVRIDDLPWAEVDDEAMLERAERMVYPRVVAARNQVRP